MARAREILFRIFYSTSFTIVFLILIAFICISPADMLYLSYKRRRLIDIFLVAGVYVVTALLAALIYASRLYTTRSVLKDIPKTYVPIEEDDLPVLKVWRLIKSTVERSAVVAALARPRARRIEVEVEGARERIGEVLRPEMRRNADGEGDAGWEGVVTRWGRISHAGWSSPANLEMPGLHYDSVVGEFTDLVEARAVSLAPLDPMATPGEDGAPVPDARVIAALTRPDALGMRGYVERLVDLEVLSGGEVTMAFLTLYERARFALEPLSEDEFRGLTRLFAEVLRGMRSVNLDLVEFGESDDEDEDEDEDEGDEGGDRDEMMGDENGDTGSIERKSYSNSRFSLASSISGSVRRRSMGSRRGSDGSVVVMPKGDG